MCLRLLLTILSALFLSNAHAQTTWKTDSASARELTELNNKLIAAYQRGDMETLRSLLAKEHVHNNVFGSKLDKETFLKDIESGVLEFLRYETPEIEWVIRGDIAIATGLIDADAVRDGKPVPANQFRFTRIYVKELGEWKVLLFHNTMAGQPPAP
ncbi:MAG: nuclear transport factor 2 family protein [Verrucomicrobiales bacterium]|nr:nuclear transport factor 2 family protein [Verrucomicrobiales bacterium]